MSGNITLDVESRAVIGKQVKQLRRDGKVPGIIYGPLADQPISVVVDWMILRPILSEAGGTKLIDISVDGTTHSVLVRDVQRHPVRREVMHIDFYAVDVTKPIITSVPLSLPNREAVSKRLSARLFQPMNRIDIQCLPGDIPFDVPIDLSVLEAAGDNITVAQIPPIKGVTLLAEDDAVVIRSISLAAIAAALEAEDEAAAAAAAAESDYEPEAEDTGEPEVIHRGKEEEEDF
jgi:large subunit ribosomal protein L25